MFIIQQKQKQLNIKSEEKNISNLVDISKTLIVFIDLFFYNNKISLYPLKKLIKIIEQKLCIRYQY